jgi:flagellin
MSINTNLNSLMAQFNLTRSQGAQTNAMAQLSSGLRINSAKDDAAGLAVSQRMSAQVSSLNQAVRNANDGISMLQTAEGGMSQIQNMLQRMKELGTQAANGTISDTDRSYIATEVGQIKNEMDAIGNSTTFNGQHLLTGALSTTLDTTGTIGAGFAAGAASVTAVDVSSAKAGKTFTVAAYTAGDNAVTLSDGTVSQTVALGAVAANGSSQLNFDQLGVKLSLASVAGDTADNIGAALSTQTVKTTAGTGAITLQVGAGTTASDQVSLSFADMRVSSAGSLAALKTAITNFTGTSTQANATALMSQVDSALDYFSNQRATIGAVQNRLTTAASNAQSTSQNLTAAQSAIQDTDYASASASLTRANILQQAGTAMLAQANTLPNSVLTLLRG